MARPKKPGGAKTDFVKIGDVLALRPDVLDKRTRLFRRFSEIRNAINSDLGGALSETRSQLVDRFVMLALWCEQRDALAMAGQEINADAYGKIAGHMKRLADSVGLERVLRDVTPDLSTYITTKAATSEPASSQE